MDKLSRSSKIYGIVADPVRHSISPAVLNRAFQYRRMEAVYLPFLVAAPQMRDFFGLADPPHRDERGVAVRVAAGPLRQ